MEPLLLMVKIFVLDILDELNDLVFADVDYVKEFN